MGAEEGLTLLKPAVVAGMLNVSTATVRRLADTGELQYVRVGRNRRYLKASVDAFIARNMS